MRIELPEYSKLKAQLKKSAPVKKTHEKKNFKGIQQSQEVAVFLVRHSLKDQSETLKERIKERKLNLFKRRQSILANVNQNSNRNINKTVIEGINADHRLDSPNMSRSKYSDLCYQNLFATFIFLCLGSVSPMDTTQKSGEPDDSFAI